MWGTVSYLINLEMCEEFLKHIFPIYYPVDQGIAKYGINYGGYFLSKKSLVTLCDKKSIIR